MENKKVIEEGWVSRWYSGEVGGSADNCIKRDVTDLLSLWQAESGSELRSPIDLYALAHLRGCTVCDDHLPHGTVGMLVPSRAGFIIKIDSSKASRGRQRFTIAHEIAHTFFFKSDKDGRVIKAQRPIDLQEEERLCNLAAELILIPQALLADSPYLRINKPTVGIILAASKRFDVSREVAARRLKAELPALASIGFCEWIDRDYTRDKAGKSVQDDSSSPFVLSWIVSPYSKNGLNMPRRTKLANGSSIYELLAGKRKSVEGTEVRVGAKLLATLGEGRIYTRENGKPSSVLCIVTSLTMV